VVIAACAEWDRYARTEVAVMRLALMSKGLLRDLPSGFPCAFKFAAAKTARQRGAFHLGLPCGLERNTSEDYSRVTPRGLPIRAS
jgi:hypothetical protein